MRNGIVWCVRVGSIGGVVVGLEVDIVGVERIGMRGSVGWWNLEIVAWCKW